MDFSPDQNLGAETLTGAPPSPKEVKVRTMASDLASVAASGGGLPQFQNVKIADAAGRASGDSPSGAGSKTGLVAAILAFVAIIILAIAGYFAYQAVQKNASVPTPASSTQSAAGQ